MTDFFIIFFTPPPTLTMNQPNLYPFKFKMKKTTIKVAFHFNGAGNGIIPLRYIHCAHRQSPTGVLPSAFRL